MTGHDIDTRIRAALVGLGWVGSNRHLPALRASRDFTLVGLVDARAGRAAALARKYRIPNVAEADQLQAVPWLDRVDAVIIATEPERHACLAQEALAAGKHVLTEKPFAMSVADGERTMLAAREAERTLAIVHNFQFARSVRRLERDLGAGVLGAVKGLWGVQLGNPRRRLPKWYPKLPLGLFYDESPHLLYLLRHFGGSRLEFVTADIGTVCATTATPATVLARFRGTADGREIPAVLSMFFESPVSEWHFAVLGDQGLGVVDMFRDIYVRLPNDNGHTASTILRTSLAATWQHWAQHFSSGLLHVAGRLSYGNEVVYERFAAAIRNGSSPAGISDADALDVLRLQHAILAARE
jgi:scyllo-inositol 2-dehydrogenase (NADP+)